MNNLIDKPKVLGKGGRRKTFWKTFEREQP